MTVVTKQDILDAARNLGIKEGDSVIIHSSLKSFGHVDGGADTVIDAFLEAVGKTGTLVFPTLCQKDWKNVYQNWHMDADSDVGYITNVFRKRPGALRSNQATHSVSAIGKDAKYITETHGQTGKRIGIFGDTPFAADSPWEKMYKMNTKVVFIGVNMRYCTFKHYTEYCFMEKLFKSIENHPDYEKALEPVWFYGKDEGLWPLTDSEAVQKYLEDQKKVQTTTCGDSTLLCVNSKDFVDTNYRFIDELNADYMWKLPSEWIQKVRKMAEEV